MNLQRNLEPPSKLVRVGVCPDCGYGFILAVYAATISKRVVECDEKSCETSGVEDIDYGAFQHYLCPVCGEIFMKPNFVEKRQ